MARLFFTKMVFSEADGFSSIEKTVKRLCFSFWLNKGVFSAAIFLFFQASVTFAREKRNKKGKLKRA